MVDLVDAKMDYFISKIIRAANIACHDKVKQLILDQKVNYDIDDQDSQGRTVLMRTLRYPVCTQLLIDVGQASITVRDHDGATALILAARFFDKEQVKYFLELGSTEYINMRNKKGNTALMEAIYGERTECVEYFLVDGRTDVHLRNMSGETAFSLAVIQEMDSIVKHFINTGQLDGEKYYDNVKIEVLSSAINGDLESLRRLIYNGEVDIDGYSISTKRNSSSLMLCAKNGHIDCLKLLLDTGQVDINRQNSDRQTSLTLAAKNGHVDCIKFIVESGYLDMIKTGYRKGHAAFLQTCEYGHIECVKYLVSVINFDLARQWHGNSPLVFAAKNGHLECLRYLIDNWKIGFGERVCEVNRAVYRAVVAGHFDCVKFLFSTELIFGKMKYRMGGWSLLMHAAYSGCYDCLQYLIETGLYGINQSDNEGKTAFMLAAQMGHLECLQLLVNQDGVNKDQQDKNGRTALMKAASCEADNGFECVKYLVDVVKVNTSIQDCDGHTALHYAIRTKDVDRFKFIFEKERVQNLDIEMCTERSIEYLLMSAVGVGNLNCVKYLISLMKAQIFLKDETIKGHFLNSSYHAIRDPLDDCFKLLMEHVCHGDRTSLEVRKLFLDAVKIRSELLLPTFLCVGAFHWSWYPDVSLWEDHNHRKVVRELVMNSYPPAIFKYNGKQTSPLIHAFLIDDVGLVRYLMANLYLTPHDLQLFQTDTFLHNQVIHGNSSEELKQLHHQLFSTPWRLEIMSLMTIFFSLGHNSRRQNDDVKKLDFVPEVFRIRLSLLNPVRKLCVKQWDRIDFDFLHQRLSRRLNDSELKLGDCCVGNCLVFKDC